MGINRTRDQNNRDKRNSTEIETGSGGGGGGGGGSTPAGTAWRGAICYGYPGYLNNDVTPTAGNVTSITENPTGIITASGVHAGAITIPADFYYMKAWVQIGTPHENVYVRLICTSTPADPATLYARWGNNSQSWPQLNSGSPPGNYVPQSPISNYGCHTSGVIPVIPGETYVIQLKAGTTNLGGTTYDWGPSIMSFGYELLMTTAGSGGGSSSSAYYLDPVLDDGSRSSAAAPGSPTSGDRYIEPANPTGTWTKAGRLAQWDGAAWSVPLASTGAQTFVQREIYGAKLIQASTTTYGALFGNALVYSGVASGQYWMPDHAVDALHSMLKERVVSRTVTAPPVNPANFQRYIIPAGASGVWTGKTGQIAVSVSEQVSGTNTWVYTSPQEGDITWVQDEDLYVYYDPGTAAWQRLGKNLRYQDLSDVTGPFDVTTNGYVPSWDNGTGKMTLVAPGALSAHALGTHSDTNWVTPPGLANDGKVVTWDNGTGKFILTSKAAASLALDDLTDVTITAPVAGQSPVYNGAIWVNGNPTVAAHNHSLDSLSNVSTGGKVTGDLLQWNGSVWTSKTFRLDDNADVVAPSPSTGDVLTFSGGNWVNSPLASLLGGIPFRGCKVYGYPGTVTSYVESPAGIVQAGGTIKVPTGYSWLSYFVEVLPTCPTIECYLTIPGPTVVANSPAGFFGGLWNASGAPSMTWSSGSGLSSGVDPAKWSAMTIWSAPIAVSAGTTYTVNVTGNGGLVATWLASHVRAYGAILWT